LAQVTFDHVGKVYPDGTVAVDDLSLEISDGEMIVFVGPSGCGKTTALRMVAGLEIISSGRILIGSEVVNDLPPRDRDVAMVFQNYALYPHKSVFDNLAFPLRLRGLGKGEIAERVQRIAQLLELEEQLKRRPRQLSGGQRQRVAMGRAIVREPQAFLMDEPLSNLDAKLRTQMRAEISLLHKELGVTTIFVTHDQVEAMTLGERVAVMRRGELQQVAEPQVLYDYPANIFVAGFIGSPSMNFVQGTLSKGDERFLLRVGEQSIGLDRTEVASASRLGDYVGRTLIVGVRPENLEDAALVPEEAADRRLSAYVRLRESLGSEVMVHFQVEAAPAVSDELDELTEGADESVLMSALDQERRVRRTSFVGRFSIATIVEEGTTHDIAIGPGALRFFDPDTGAALALARSPQPTSSSVEAS
jgi:multiple sugar transport system ATP-binding protein